MEVKLFEIRDEGTFIPAMATRVQPRNDLEQWLISRAGFGIHGTEAGLFVIFQALHKGPSTYNAFDWAYGEDGCLKGRTMYYAHLYIKEHWEDLNSGDVIDVQYILGETKEPKCSEQYEHPSLVIQPE